MLRYIMHQGGGRERGGREKWERDQAKGKEGVAKKEKEREIDLHHLTFEL